MSSAFPFIKIGGEPHERGVQYGRNASDRIAVGLSIYRDAFEQVGIGWEKATGFARRFRDRIGEFSPAMLEEIDGIAAGADQPSEAIVALNARTEIIFWYDQETGMQTGGANDAKPGMQEECTSILALPSVTASGHLLHAQNWDWNPRCANSSIVLQIARDDGPDILTFCEAGQLARHGMNAAGISLTANGLQCDLDGGHIGVPSPLLRRRLLSSATLADALGTVLNADISFSHSLTIAHAEGSAVTLESTTQRAYWLQPENGLLVHANHFKSPAAQIRLLDIGLQRCPESLYRDQRALEKMQQAGDQVSLETIKDALADTFGSPDAILRQPKARPGGNLSGTVATLLMDTTEKRMWLAPSPYKTIEFTEYGFE